MKKLPRAVKKYAIYSKNGSLAGDDLDLRRAEIHSYRSDAESRSFPERGEYVLAVLITPIERKKRQVRK